MPSNAVDFGHRAQLTEFMDEPCSRDELRACLRDLARLNRWFLAYRPLLDWLDIVASSSSAQPLHILDVACGYGDSLRRVERWSHANAIAVELTGLDLNPDAIAIATETTPSTSAIRWVASDVFTFEPDKPVHLIVSSLFTHHLTEPDVIRFVKWMEVNSKLGWFINDLSRAAAPYHLLRIFSKIAGLHRFVQHDGPVSIARSFIPDDWNRISAAAGLHQDDVSIQPSFPARLCVSRNKTP
jgi:SAM-dependent methyltransferase